MATKLWAMVVMFLLTFLTSTAQILWKLGSKEISLNIMSIITNWDILAGLVLYSIAGIMMIVSFRGGDVSVLYPIVATSYIWVSLLSIFFLSEHMNVFKWLGVIVIFSGIVMIGYGSSQKTPAKAGA